MTVTDIRPHLIAESEPTPESDRVAELRAMLNDPRWSHAEAEIRAAIEYLTATTVLAA